MHPGPVIAPCCCGHLLASTTSLASLSILSLALCVRISLSLRSISLRHRSCSVLSSITLCIKDDALATPCSNAAGLLFVDSTDSTKQRGKGSIGKNTVCPEFWGTNSTKQIIIFYHINFDHAVYIVNVSEKTLRSMRRTRSRFSFNVSTINRKC